MLSLDCVSKDYDFLPILDNVTLTLRLGHYYVLTAPNGSGKSTLLQIMAGIMKPTQGVVRWDGKPFSTQHRSLIGVMLQSSFLFGDLSGIENLNLYATLYGLQSSKTVVEDAIRFSGLKESSDYRVRDYSKGMQQRLSFARALLHAPRVLLLDEPFDGLDVETANRFKRKLLELVHERGTTVFMVTHQEADTVDAQTRLTLRHGFVKEVSS